MNTCLMLLNRWECAVRDDGKYAKLNIFDQFIAVDEATPVLEKLYSSINAVQDQ